MHKVRAAPQANSRVVAVIAEADEMNAWADHDSVNKPVAMRGPMVALKRACQMFAAMTAGSFKRFAGFPRCHHPANSGGLITFGGASLNIGAMSAGL